MAIGAALPVIIGLVVCVVSGGYRDTWVEPRAYIPGVPCYSVFDPLILAGNILPFCALAAVGALTLRSSPLHELDRVGIVAIVLAVDAMLFVVPDLLEGDTAWAAVLIALPVALLLSFELPGTRCAGFVGSALALLQMAAFTNLDIWETIFFRLPGKSMVHVAAAMTVPPHLIMAAVGWATGVAAYMASRLLVGVVSMIRPSRGTS